MADPGGEAIPPLFRDVTESLGIEFTHRVDLGGKFALPEIMGSGLAVFDANGDERLDLYLLDAGNAPEAGAPNELFLRSEDGQYTNATDQSGLGDTGYGMGVAVGDVDNDGDLDVYVGNWGPDALYLNQGAGSFLEATDRSGIVGDGWASSVAMFDYDIDGYLDVYVARYVQFVPEMKCTNSKSRRDYCGPMAFKGERDILYRNRGDGTFEDTSESAGISTIARRALGVLVEDFNDDGWPDLFVANDGEANLLWINQRDGTFVDEGYAAGVAVNGQGTAEASMGVAVGDVDSDGDLDLFMTHLVDETNTLYLREGEYGFSDGTAISGLGRTGLSDTGFGTAFFDADLDGDLDLAVANGAVEQREPYPQAAYDALWNFYAERNLFFLNDGKGRFSDGSPSSGAFHGDIDVSRGLAAVDMDGDGDLEMVVTNCRGPARVYDNLSDGGHWLQVDVRDEQLNRSVFGARVTVRAGPLRLSRTMGSATSYLTSVVAPLHFGLAANERIDAIEVSWPGGVVETFSPPSVDSVVTLFRGDGN